MIVNIHMKILLIIIIFIVVCNTNAVEKLKELKNDFDKYSKLENIKRDIEYSSKKTLDIYYRKNEINELKPVVIHIYGESWYKGNKVKFTNIGSLLDEYGYIAVLPNYGPFPYESFENMIYDIYTVINWTFENIKKYGGDPEKMTIVGHSAGAHLVILTLLKSYLRMNNNNIILEPLPTLEKIVLLSGIYNFNDYDLLTQYFDKTIDKSLLEKFISVLYGAKDVSPYNIIVSIPDKSIADSLNVKKFIFYYTANDEKVPESSAKELMNELERTCNNTDIHYVYNEGQYGHNDIINGIRSGDEVQENVYISLIIN